MTKIFIADISGLDIEKSLGLVSAHRREKVIGLAHDGDKRRSLGVELLLKKAVGRSDYVLSENGRPFFADCKAFFSLAHCGSYAVCAVSDGNVGVDIELPRPGSTRLAERFFLPDEAALVNAAEEADREFCRLWTLKESYIKYADLRLGDIRSVSVAQGIPGCRICSFVYAEHFIGCCITAQDDDEIIIVKEKL